MLHKLGHVSSPNDVTSAKLLLVHSIAGYMLRPRRPQPSCSYFTIMTAEPLHRALSIPYLAA